MQPLEGFYYFTQVVEHGGYAKASRALGIPKSRLSRHVAALETQLNVRLVNRSTRRFVVTDVGHEVHRHAVAMLAEADAALEAVEFARAEDTWGFLADGSGTYETVKGIVQTARDNSKTVVLAARMEPEMELARRLTNSVAP